MSDISKSNMHESTMLPMAQQTNPQIKEHSGGKLRERSRSYFILETKQKKKAGEGGRVKQKKKVSLMNYFLFLLEEF